MTSVLTDAKAYQHAVQMSRNRTEPLAKTTEVMAAEEKGMMTKMEMIEEEVEEVAEATVEAEEAEAMAAVVIDKTVEIEEEIVRTAAAVAEEEIMTEEMVVTLEATEAAEAETVVAGVATPEVQVGTKAQATTTTSDPNPKASIETMAMIQLKVEILLIQVINFQLLQHHLTLKILELKSTMTLNPKRNHTTLLDHRQTPLFI